jgi:hypothetical protein
MKTTLFSGITLGLLLAYLNLKERRITPVHYHVTARMAGVMIILRCAMKDGIL